MVFGSTLLSTTLVPIVSIAAITQVVKTVWPMTGKPGSRGKAVLHWHYKSRTQAASHRHPGGSVSHMHRGLPGYGRKKSTLRR